jgi:hypothetical protein
LTFAPKINKSNYKKAEAHREKIEAGLGTETDIVTKIYKKHAFK